jgi:hypothetical protein
MTNSCGVGDQLPELRRQRWLCRAMPTSGCHMDIYHQIDAWEWKLAASEIPIIFDKSQKMKVLSNAVFIF